MPTAWEIAGSQIGYPTGTLPPSEGGADDPFGEGPPWWAVLGPGIIAASGATLSSIFRRYPETPTYAQTRPYTVGGGAPSATTNYGGAGGVGIGIDGQGIRLSDGSHIGWLPIGAVVLGFVLLQSQGFSRRRNPATVKRNPRKRRRHARRR